VDRFHMHNHPRVALFTRTFRTLYKSVITTAGHLFTGRDHFHHRLSDLGLGNKRAVWVIYFISAGQGLQALVSKNAQGVDALFSILQVGLTYLLMGAFMVFVHNRYIRLLEIRRSTPP